VKSSIASLYCLFSSFSNPRLTKSSLLLNKSRIPANPFAAFSITELVPLPTLSTVDFIPLAVLSIASSPFAPAKAPPARARGTVVGPVTPKKPTVTIAPTTAPNLFLAVKSLNIHSFAMSATISSGNTVI
jgi:hypothetical protein